MSKGAASSSLELNDNPSFQRRFWVAERTSWLIFLAIVSASLLGLTGMGGPLSRAQAETAAAHIDYPRITRWQSSEHIRINLAASPEDQAELVLGPAFSTSFEIEGATPEPARSVTTAAGTRLVFERAPNQEGEIILHVKPVKTSWLAPHEVTVDGSATTLAILIMP
jgi:hypothetical protein